VGSTVGRSSAAARIPSSTTTTEVPATTTTMAVPVPVVASPVPVVTTTCGDAIAYLLAHQAPGFSASCGAGSAFGRLGVTCWNIATMCPDGAKIIHIACPAPFVYMNEAHNSWTIVGEGAGIDPYGQGSSAERSYCADFR
jgi:hypothetical protein